MGTTSDAVDAVLAWYDTEDARARAGKIARDWGLGGLDGVAENVLHEARIRMWERGQSPTPLQLDQPPAAYGTTVLKRVVGRITSGRDAIDELPDHTAVADPGIGEVDDAEVDLDRLRRAVEQVPAREPWMTAAALGYLTVTMHPDEVPTSAPAPIAGSPPHQARCWPALWFAGERQIFHSGDDERADNRVRRTRARRIGAVLNHIDRARAEYELELRSTDV